MMYNAHVLFVQLLANVGIFFIFKIGLLSFLLNPFVLVCEFFQVSGRLWTSDTRNFR